MRTAAITGASGFLGSRLAVRMEGAGWEVRRLQRTGADGAPGRGLFSLEEPPDDAALQGVDVLVHCAFDYDAGDSETNVRGSRMLFECAGRAGVSRTISVSSLHAFEGCRSRYGRTKRAIEAMTLAGGGIVVRPGTIFETSGEGLAGGVGGQTLRQLDRLSRRVSILPVPSSRKPSIYLTHIDDLCSLILEIATREEIVVSEPVIAANREPYTLPDLLRAMRKRADGKALRILPIPWRIAWLGVRVGELAGFRSGIRSESIALLFDQDPAPRFEAAARFQTSFKRL